MKDSIIEYWMDITETTEFKELAKTEDIEIAKVKDKIERLIEDEFISISRETGIARREKLLGIVPFHDDNLEIRRFRVAGKWDSKLPYTYRGLIERLNTLCGEDKYVIELNPGEFTLSLLMELVVKRLHEEVDAIVRSMCPANLHIKIGFRYRRYEELSPYTHEHLSKYSHNNLKEGEKL